MKNKKCSHYYCLYISQMDAISSVTSINCKMKIIHNLLMIKAKKYQLLAPIRATIFIHLIARIRPERRDLSVCTKLPLTSPLSPHFV